MKKNNTLSIRIVIFVALIIMAFVSIRFLMGVFTGFNQIINAQTNEEVNEMKNHSDQNLLTSLKDTYQFPDSTILTKKGVITIKRDISYQEFSYVTPGYNILLLSIQMVYFILVFSVLLLVIKLFKSSMHGEIFIRQNVRRIQKIAWLLFVYIIFILLNGLFMNSILFSLFNSAQTSPAVEINFETIFPLLFVAMVVVALSELFREGVNLKEENDLTI